MTLWVITTAARPCSRIIRLHTFTIIMRMLLQSNVILAAILTISEQRCYFPVAERTWKRRIRACMQLLRPATLSEIKFHNAFERWKMSCAVRNINLRCVSTATSGFFLQIRWRLRQSFLRTLLVHAIWRKRMILCRSGAVISGVITPCLCAVVSIICSLGA